jgi:hypothetical protein
MASPTTLNQILAVRQGVQADARRDVTTLHREVGKAPRLSGITRTYDKIDDEAPDLPTESTRVQIVATDIVKDVAMHLTRLFDVTAIVDWTNQGANADIVVDGQILAANVPATYLLFLAKQLEDVETFVRKLPVLDPSESWSWDPAANAWATEPSRTTKTAKVMRNHVLAAATDKHPAQVQAYTEDVIAGYWRTRKFSGAAPADLVEKMTARVVKLAEAVKFARERANMVEVTDPKPGAALFAYLLADLE